MAKRNKIPARAVVAEGRVTAMRGSPAAEQAAQPMRLWRGAMRTEAQIVELERLRAIAFPGVK